MNKLGRFFYNVLKGIYDILATYLLLWVIYITIVSLGLHAAFSLAAQALDFDSLALMWRVLSRKIGVSPIWVRLVIYGALQLGIYWLLRNPLEVVLRGVERVITAIQRAYLKVAQRLPRFQRVFGVVFTIAITLVLIPFVVQPTLVPMRVGSSAMVQRAANLADGTATLGFADSVVGFYRRLYAEPEPLKGMPAKQIEDALDQQDQGYGDVHAPVDTGPQPLMDRWDDYIRGASGGDPRQFAYVKAFMWVESAGRQFAVSHTGCLGLMQFCAGTARNKTFRKIFGVGQVYVCRCDGPCKVPRDVKRDMERGDRDLIEQRADEFPCELSDARFNGDKAIRAGSLYVKNLRESFGGNIYLMYIGYNSGPAVARKVYEAVGRDPDASLEEIGQHLSASLQPWYGEKAERRARGLLKIHLPKIKRAYDRYYADTQKDAKVSWAPTAPALAPAYMPADTLPEVAMLIDELHTR